MGNIFNSDFRDFILALNENEVNYLLVGGYAVILHGHSRVTGDMDIWVNRTQANYLRLQKAFYQFHMPVMDMTLDNFLKHEDWDVFRFGRKPVAIDIMTKMAGFDFEECYKKAVFFEDDGLSIRVIHINQLLEAKKIAGRGKDMDDIKFLS
jgi:hypothetical protein